MNDCFVEISRAQILICSSLGSEDIDFKDPGMKVVTFRSQGSENIDDNNNKLITLSIYPFIHHLSFLLPIKRNRCQSCMYQYSPKKGDDFYPVSAGTPFKDLPEDWNCPVCGASKSKFKSIGRQVAGFEQNQGYGFGTNSMTEGEKSKLIYGGLALFFAFFLAGYLLE